MKAIINKKVLLTVVYPMVICLMSILPLSLKAGNPILSDDNLRNDISSYLRDSYKQWREQATPSALKDSDENYRDFLQNTGIGDSLIHKLFNNNELILRLFDGLKAKYTTEENASICRKILKEKDIYVGENFFIGYGFLRITITCNYTLRVENVYNKVLEKYASAKPSTVPPDFSTTLQTALIEEAQRGILKTFRIDKYVPYLGRCQLEMEYNTINGEVFADFYNGGHGIEMKLWNGTFPMDEYKDIFMGHPYGDLWTGLWDAISTELKGTYSSQNMEIKSWNIYSLNLHLSGYNPYKYRLAVYINVDGGWWIKPSWSRSYPVGFDIQYHIPTNTGGIDYTATKVAAIILPFSADVDINNYNAAKAVAVNYVESSPTEIPAVTRQDLDF